MSVVLLSHQLSSSAAAIDGGAHRAAIVGGRCQQVWQHRLALDSIVWRLLIIREAVLLLLFLWSLFFAEAESEAEAISEQATQAKRVVAVVVVVVVVAVMAMAVLDVCAQCEL